MADHYRQFSFEIENVSPTEAAWLSLRVKQAEEVQEDGFYAVLPDCTFETSDDECALWIHDDAGGSDLGILSEILQGFLAEFRPDDYITFSWANTCSKPRLDAFGGGAVFITSTGVKWIHTSNWQTKEVARLKENTK